jgi:hypothetical protein
MVDAIVGVCIVGKDHSLKTGSQRDWDPTVSLKTSFNDLKTSH